MTEEDPSRDGFDLWLADALGRWPEVAAGIDVGGEALVRAEVLRLREIRLARLARLTRWARVATLAAGALIAATVIIGYRFLPAAVSTTSTATDSSSTTSSSGWDLTMIGMAVFFVTLIVMVLAALFRAERPQLRFMVR